MPIFDRQRLLNILDYFDAMGILQNGVYSIELAEDLLVNPRLMDESPNLKRALELLELFEKLLRKAHISYEEWFDFAISRNINATGNNRYEFTFDHFSLEINKLCQDLHVQMLQEEDLRLVFHHITGSNDAEVLIQYEHVDVAFKNYRSNLAKLKKLNVVVAQLRDIGTFMSTQSVHLGGKEHVLTTSVLPSEMEKILGNLILKYDIYVSKTGPTDFSGHEEYGQANAHSHSDKYASFLPGGSKKLGAPSRPMDSVTRKSTIMSMVKSALPRGISMKIYSESQDEYEQQEQAKREKEEKERIEREEAAKAAALKNKASIEVDREFVATMSMEERKALQNFVQKLEEGEDFVPEKVVRVTSSDSGKKPVVRNLRHSTSFLKSFSNRVASFKIFKSSYDEDEEDEEEEDEPEGLKPDHDGPTITSHMTSNSKASQKNGKLPKKKTTANSSHPSLLSTFGKRLGFVGGNKSTKKPKK